MRRTGALLVLVALGAAAEAPSDAAVELSQLRESAREALSTSCGRCHDRTRSTARPAALRIFDLHERDWSARVTDVQMDHMVERFEGFRMPQADRVAVTRFLDAERASRAALATPPVDAAAAR
ncbi:MAG: hypothetical protein EHM78_01380 [Myxococcaceae bacterium]|nr:MAG: hypothetical protein EHM78_01380 [Myxococcaceae bacterium]